MSTNITRSQVLLIVWDMEDRTAKIGTAHYRKKDQPRGVGRSPGNIGNFTGCKLLLNENQVKDYNSSKV